MLSSFLHKSQPPCFSMSFRFFFFKSEARNQEYLWSNSNAEIWPLKKNFTLCFMLSHPNLIWHELFHAVYLYTFQSIKSNEWITRKEEGKDRSLVLIVFLFDAEVSRILLFFFGIETHVTNYSLRTRLEVICSRPLVFVLLYTEPWLGQMAILIALSLHIPQEVFSYFLLLIIHKSQLIKYMTTIFSVYKLSCAKCYA